MLLALLTVAYFAWIAWPQAWTAAESIRLISAFSADEAAHVELLQDAIRDRSLRLDFISYGHLVFNLALLPLMVKSLVAPVSEREIIVGLRLVSTAFAVATVVVTFMLTRRYFGRPAAWLAALLLSVVPLEFVRLATVSHPDVPQLFFLMLGLYGVCRLIEDADRRWLRLASTAAGLAFAAKYAGVFLLPLIWAVAAATIERTPEPRPEATRRFLRWARHGVALLGVVGVGVAILFTPVFVELRLDPGGGLDAAWKLELLAVLRIAAAVTGSGLLLLAAATPVWAALARRSRLAGLCREGLLSCALFAGAFALASPASLARLGFLQGIIFEARHTSFGHWFAADRTGLDWLGVLVGPELLDVVILDLAAVGLGLTVHRAWKTGRRGLLTPGVVLWAWCIGFVVLLVLRVNIVQPRYLLPVVPALLILATEPIASGFDLLRKRLPAGAAAGLTAGLLVAIAAVELPPALHRAIEHRQETIRREETSVAVRVGRWLERRFPTSTRILHDPYVYVPPPFTDAHSEWRPSVRLLQTLSPELVVIDEHYARRFSDLGEAGGFKLGEEGFLERYDYYRGIRDGSLGYALERDFGGIRVYRRRALEPVGADHGGKPGASRV